jgi:hypothetical protein
LSRSDTEIGDTTLRESGCKVVDLDFTKADLKTVDVDLTEIDGNPTNRAEVVLETVKVELSTLGTRIKVVAKGASQSPIVATVTVTATSSMLAAVAAGIGVSAGTALAVGVSVAVGTFTLMQVIFHLPRMAKAGRSN